MNLDKMIDNELNNVHQLTYNLYMTETNIQSSNTYIESVIEYMENQLKNINNIKYQLIESLDKLKKQKQLICQHDIITDNLNYEPMQIICTKCNKIFY
jgi:hypothetical protein